MTWSLSEAFQKLKTFAGRPWYPLVIGVLNAADMFLLFIPNDPLLVAGALMRTNTLPLAITVAFFSTCGVAMLCGCVQYLGMEWLQGLFPVVFESSAYHTVASYTQIYGPVVLFVGAAGPPPLVIHPFVCVALMTKMDTKLLLAVFFTGRVLRYLAVCQLATSARKLGGNAKEQ